MAVVATAGHVDHGKSALVRALTGTDPDRLPEERRRGMTIELGHAWVDLDGTRVALVDVPGHDRLVGTTIAGIGPAAGVLLVVAADEGWSAQTEEHVAAVRALGLRAVGVVVTKADLADGAPVLVDAVARLGAHGIAPLATALASARTGAGLDDARDVLRALAAAAVAPDPAAAVRFWVDRSFTVTGSGTVVTGTLPAGTVRAGDDLEVGGRRVRVRGLQVHGGPVEQASGPTRLAVNLRAVPTSAVPRGSHLATPGAVHAVQVVDVLLHRLVERLPENAVLHVGTTTAPVRVRPLGDAHARLTLGAGQDLPLLEGDRVLLRDPGAHEVLAGADVLATDPPPFTRRGAASRRAGELASGVTSPVADRSPGPGASPPEPATGALGPILAWLADHPFGAAPAELLADPDVTPAALATAERDGRLLRTGGAVLAGDAVERAVPVLAALPDGFGPGDAARALGTSRRAAVALLERLDALGATRRSPDGTRRVRPRP
ncbi:selenocysteine-specific translation elongation factor [Oryzobacter terrae]|uniref:selenocysteine-specific translation elongation factor n=1 Tax=Oryzobacter terrae TaxID=1620385 RepID=UPI003670808F